MKITSLDPHQIAQYKYDDERRADRVILVGGEKLNINADLGGLEAKVQELSSSLKLLSNTVPPMQNAPEVKIVEVPKIEVVKQVQYKEIEKPVIVKQVEYKEVQVPVIVTDKQIVEVEKPVLVEKLIDFPIWLKLCLAIQTLAIIAIAIKH